MLRVPAAVAVAILRLLLLLAVVLLRWLLRHRHIIIIIIIIISRIEGGWWRAGGWWRDRVLDVRGAVRGSRKISEHPGKTNAAAAAGKARQDERSRIHR
jgi:hypothetical protein